MTENRMTVSLSRMLESSSTTANLRTIANLRTTGIRMTGNHRMTANRMTGRSMIANRTTAVCHDHAKHEERAHGSLL